VRQDTRGSSNPNWKGGPVTLFCIECGLGFSVLHALSKTRKFCSNVCVGRWVSKNRRGDRHANWKGGPKTRIFNKKQTRQRRQRMCKLCGNSGVRKGRHYHPECSPRQGNSKKLLACVDCGVIRTQFVAKNRKAPSRCVACARKHRCGEYNGRWRGGITPQNKKIRASKEYSEWRRQVFERDNHTCVWCGQVSGKLHADHIYPFSLFPNLRFFIQNGRTLCVPCHMKTETYLSGAKRPLNRTGADQAAFLDKALANGAVAGVARSVDDVQALMIHVKPEG